MNKIYTKVQPGLSII